MRTALPEWVATALYRAREGHLLNPRTVAMLRARGYLKDGPQPRRSWLNEAGEKALDDELERRMTPESRARSERAMKVYRERRARAAGKPT